MTTSGTSVPVLRATLPRRSDVPPRAHEILAALPDDTEVVAYDAPAAALARALRRSRRAGEPGNDALAAPLDALGDDPVLVRQVDLGNELLTVLHRSNSSDSSRPTTPSDASSRALDRPLRRSRPSSVWPPSGAPRSSTSTPSSPRCPASALTTSPSVHSTFPGRW